MQMNGDVIGVLASGSLNRFWDIKDISGQKIEVPNIIDSTLQNPLRVFENRRIEYKNDLTPQSLEMFADSVQQSQGPRLVILNSVQSAAVVAEYIS